MPVPYEVDLHDTYYQPEPAIVAPGIPLVMTLAPRLVTMSPLDTRGVHFFSREPDAGDEARVTRYATATKGGVIVNPTGARYLSIPAPRGPPGQRALLGGADAREDKRGLPVMVPAIPKVPPGVMPQSPLPGDENPQVENAQEPRTTTSLQKRRTHAGTKAYHKASTTSRQTYHAHFY